MKLPEAKTWVIYRPSSGYATYIPNHVTTFGLHESFLTRVEQIINCSVWQERTERARRTAVYFFPEHIAITWPDIYTGSYIDDRPVSPLLV